MQHSEKKRGGGQLTSQINFIGYYKDLLQILHPTNRRLKRQTTKSTLVLCHMHPFLQLLYPFKTTNRLKETKDSIASPKIILHIICLQT